MASHKKKKKKRSVIEPDKTKSLSKKSIKSQLKLISKENKNFFRWKKKKVRRYLEKQYNMKFEDNDLKKMIDKIFLRMKEKAQRKKEDAMNTSLKSRKNLSSNNSSNDEDNIIDNENFSPSTSTIIDKQDKKVIKMDDLPYSSSNNNVTTKIKDDKNDKQTKRKQKRSSSNSSYEPPTKDNHSYGKRTSYNRNASISQKLNSEDDISNKNFSKNKDNLINFHKENKDLSNKKKKRDKPIKTGIFTENDMNILMDIYEERIEQKVCICV